MDDEALLTRWLAGDRDAAETLIARYFKVVRRFVGGVVPHDADELTQRTFLAVLEGARRIERPQHFRAYLFGIARNQILRRFQERHADRSLEELSCTPAARWLESPTSHVRKREHRHELLEALKQLPTDVQLTLQLHYWADLSVDDIAQITDVATGTVRSRLTRGRQTLSTLLGNTATTG